MFKSFKSTNIEHNNKTNLKYLIIITIILAIFIIVCLIFLFKGIADNISNLSDKENNKLNKNKFGEIELFYPMEAQLISTSLGSNDELLLRYQLKGKTVLVIIDTLNNTVKNKIFLLKGNDWVIKEKIK